MHPSRRDYPLGYVLGLVLGLLPGSLASLTFPVGLDLHPLVCLLLGFLPSDSVALLQFTHELNRAFRQSAPDRVSLRPR
jgi:hypothetical protein